MAFVLTSLFLAIARRTIEIISSDIASIVQIWTTGYEELATCSLGFLK